MGFKRYVLPVFTVIALLLGGAALVAGDDGSPDVGRRGHPMDPDERLRHRVRGEIGHREARHLVQEGVIRPLSELMAPVQARYPGPMLEADLHREDGAYFYEVELLSAKRGDVIELKIDAVSGAILDVDRED